MENQQVQELYKNTFSYRLSMLKIAFLNIFKKNKIKEPSFRDDKDWKHLDDDLKFLSDLQKELKNQDNDFQASPRFWVVRQWEKEVTHSDFSDGQILVIYDDGEYTEFDDESDISDFIKHMEDHYEKEWNKIKNDKLYENMSDIIEIIDEECLDGFNIYDYKKVAVIKENTMFLTKQEAQNHIKANYYHYNKSVHTYAMTAWRAPKVERLLCILENFDWEDINHG